jgi:hypothetical protein
VVALNETNRAAADRQENGPDPVVGVGLVIVGILIMGIGGAANAHYLFNFGTAVAILGAVLFVAFVTLSTYRQKSAAEKKAADVGAQAKRSAASKAEGSSLKDPDTKKKARAKSA